jgi:threonine dehydratase
VIPFVVPDAETVRGCLEFLDNHFMLIEPACAAAVATALYHEKEVRELIFGSGDGENEVDKKRPVVVEACGGSLVSFDLLKTWATQLLSQQ